MTTTELILFWFAGLLAIGGGLLWTGMYGVPQNTMAGFVVFVLGLCCTGVFLGLADGEADKSDNRPPD